MKNLLLVALMGLTLTVSSAFAECDPAIPSTCIGPQGLPGIDGANAWAYENLEAGLAATSSVELNLTTKV